MPVVINEFEAVADAPPLVPAAGSQAKPVESSVRPENARDLLAPARVLEVEQLRVWAH